MRHSRLKSKLANMALKSTQPTLPAIDKLETPIKLEPGKNSEKDTIVQHPTLTFTDAPIDKARDDSKSMTVPEIRLPHKRPIHVQKIDISAVFETTSPLTLGASIRHEGETSEYEDDQAAAGLDNGFLWDSESEPDHRPAKRQRISSIHALFCSPPQIPSLGVLTQTSPAFNAAVSPDLSIPNPSPTAQPRRSPSPLSPCMAPYPNLSNSLFSTGALYGGAADNTGLHHVSTITISSPAPATSPPSDNERDVHMTDGASPGDLPPPIPFPFPLHPSWPSSHPPHQLSHLP